MSSGRRRRRTSTSPMPAAGAGLLRFFEEDTPGLRVRPELVVIFAIAFVIVSLLAQLTF